jgi:hypothetical protein
MIPDQILIQTARSLATGANVHKLNNLICIYKTWCMCDKIEYIKESEIVLQMFVTAAKSKKLSDEHIVSYFNYND